MTKTLNHPRWAFGLMIFFLIAMVLGLTPWETTLSIQIRNKVLLLLTNSSFGLFGLIGFLITLWIFIKDVSRLALSIKLASGCLAIPLAFLLLLDFVLPTFRWYDTMIYRNGNEYLIVQEQETFVTSNLKRPHVIRTKSPYSIIRKVEEEFEIQDNDDRFGGKEAIYKGIKWIKESTITKTTNSLNSIHHK